MITQEQTKALSNLIEEILDYAQANPNAESYELDWSGKPLIKFLADNGIIPSTRAHIEWSGVYEHGLVPVFYTGENNSYGVMNIYRNGLIERF